MVNAVFFAAAGRGGRRLFPAAYYDDGNIAMFFGCPARGERNGIKYKERQLFGVLYIPLVPPEARASLHSAAASLMKTAGKQAHPFAVLPAIFGGERAAVPTADSTPFPAQRSKRYNTLDLASKVVRQRRARPSLGTLPDTGKNVATLFENRIFVGICFRSVFVNRQSPPHAKPNENGERETRRESVFRGTMLVRYREQ